MVATNWPAIVSGPGPPASAQRDATGEIRDLTDLDAYAIFQIVATFIIGVSVIVSPRRALGTSRRVLFRSPMCWLVCYYAMAMLSALWSEAPLLTLFKASQCAVFLVVVAMAIDGLQVIRYRIAFLCCMSLQMGVLPRICSVGDSGRRSQHWRIAQCACGDAVSAGIVPCWAQRAAVVVAGIQGTYHYCCDCRDRSDYVSRALLCLCTTGVPVDAGANAGGNSSDRSGRFGMAVRLASRRSLAPFCILVGRSN